MRTVPMIPQPLSSLLVKKCYALGCEQSLEDVFDRVAEVLASHEEPRVRAFWSQRFRKAMDAGFIPSGAILHGASKDLLSPLASSFMLDGAFADAHVGIAVKGDASDPAAPGAIPELVCLPVGHPQLLSLIEARLMGSLSGCHISVLIPDRFMHQVKALGRLPSSQAGATWQYLVRSAYDSGEPRMIFIDRVGADNNLSDQEDLLGTSACGDLPLPKFGSSCSGVLDLPRFVKDAFTDRATWDFDRLHDTMPLVVRMLDNALSVTPWPRVEQCVEALSTRRVAIGMTGLGDALAMQGINYGSDLARVSAKIWVQRMRDEAYAASCALAQERGAFPRFDAASYLASPHAASRLPAVLHHQILSGGIRNSHLMSIGPNETLSFACADHSSCGVEPARLAAETHYLRDPSGLMQAYLCTDHALRSRAHLQLKSDAIWDRVLESATHIDPVDIVRMAATLTPYVDGCIVRNIYRQPHMSLQEFEELCLLGWDLGLKELATFTGRDSFSHLYRSRGEWQC